MVQLKQVSLRLKSIKNIQKITKTMKMVAASKFTKIERELENARPFGYGPRKFYESSHLMKDATSRKLEKDKPAPQLDAPEEKGLKDVKGKAKYQIYVAVTSDRGLCGGVHSGIARKIRRSITERNADAKGNKIICVGDKSRTMLRRLFPNHMLVSVRDVGREIPVFKDAGEIASALNYVDFKYDFGEIYYNKYYSPVKYELAIIPFYNKHYIEGAPNMHTFDDVEEDQLQSYAEWTLAAMLYYTLKESAASEQSARMSAMDNATKNADDMIRKLTLLYNRTRQAVITRELIEIISGAAALK